MLLKPTAHIIRPRLINFTPRHLPVQARKISTIAEKKTLEVDVTTFRREVFDAEKPFVLRGAAASFPAISKWFTTAENGKAILTPYFNGHRRIEVPYELSTTRDGGGPKFSDFVKWIIDGPAHMQGKPTEEIWHPDDARRFRENLDSHLRYAPESEERVFIHFHAPLALLDAALHYPPNSGPPPSSCLRDLYIAQADIRDVFKGTPLADDVPVPEFVRTAGKGDVYSTSLWLGLEPTFTPWHRDPNPNFFCQMCGTKAVRLAPLNRGKNLYEKVRVQMARDSGVPGSPVSTRVRGAEMMMGDERNALLEAVWGTHAPAELKEAMLGPGDALFIPKGWWHSLKSGGSDGDLNASVNWWFR